MIHRWPTDSVPERLVFISDLHLFSSRSDAQLHEEAMREAVGWGEVCVWGGDLFDFRWSGDRSGAATVRRSIEWLQRWCDEFPAQSFVFLNGNHDAHAPFAKALASWTESNPRFQSGLECLRVADTLLLHGDVIQGDGSAEAFLRYRQRWSGKPTAGLLQNRAYDLAIATGMHKAVASAAHRNKQTCLRLLRWIHRQPSELVSGIDRVVFGHTHRMLHGMRVNQVQFFNGGAAIRHVPFAPIKLSF